MDAILRNALIFLGFSIVGMLAHYVKSWTKGEISGNLLDYLFRDNPRATVASFSGVVGATATAYFTNTLTGLDLQALIPFAFTAGFGIDSTLNKGGVAPAASAEKPKQGGFSSIGFVMILLFLSLAGACFIGSMSACATTGPTLDQRLLQAESTATAALSVSTSLLNNGTITLAQDQTVRKSHDVVVKAAHVAHTLIATGDAAGAAAQLSAIQADTDLLAAFVAAH